MQLIMVLEHVWITIKLVAQHHVLTPPPPCPPLGRSTSCLSQAMNDGGIPIEPFHLRNELLEGFFDAMGNYIAFRNDDDTDAWLESLDVSLPHRLPRVEKPQLVFKPLV